MITPPFTEWIAVQHEFVTSHRGLRHPFFDQLPRYVQQREFLRSAFKQMYHLVLGFPFHIAGAIATSRDEDILNILVRNLYLEVGGDKGDLHINLFRRLLKAVDLPVDRPAPEDLWLEIKALERSCDNLYRNLNMGTKLGALYAFETMSSPMVMKWDQALSRLNWITKDTYEFFTIHIDIELDHAYDIANITCKYWQSRSFQQDFINSSALIMEGLEKFWDRLQFVGEQFSDSKNTNSSTRNVVTEA